MAARVVLLLGCVATLTSTVPGCGSGAGLNAGGPDDRPTLPEEVTDDTPSSEDPPSDNDGEDPIDPAGADDPPAMTIGAAPVFCCNPLSLTFTAEISDPALLRGAQFEWDFGDRRTGAGPSVEHTYAWPGTYYVVLMAALPGGVGLQDYRVLELSIDDGQTDVVLSPPAQAPSDGADAPPADDAAFNVDAGEDQFVGAGASVTLRATVSNAAADVALSWVQLFGPNVTLTAGDAESVSFVAPASDTLAQTLTFRVSATDGQSLALDDVRVVVSPAGGAPPPPPPPPDQTPQNHAPVVGDLSANARPAEAVQLELRGSDADGDDLTFHVVSGPLHGRLGSVAKTGALTASVAYTSNTAYTGTDSFRFSASDGSTTSNVATATVTVTATGTAPVVPDHTFLVPVGTATGLTVSGTAGGNGSGTGGDLTFAVVTPPRHGTLGTIDNSAPAGAVVVYTPTPGYEGDDSFTVVAAASGWTSPPATVHLAVRKRLIPWHEVNTPTADALSLYTTAQGAEPGMTRLDYCLRGIESWADVTDTVIVTTAPTQIDRLYPELMRRKPAHVRIIGGTKTYNLPGVSAGDTRPYQFADAATWATIAQQAARIAQWTNQDVVVLDNETSLEPFVAGLAPIDTTALPTALAAFDAAGVTPWWWLPWIMSDDLVAFPDRGLRSTELVSAMAAGVPDAVFMTQYIAYYGWESSKALQQRRTAMAQLVGLDHVLEGMFVTEDGYLEAPGGTIRCFTPAEAVQKVPLATGDAVRVYTGGGDWILVAHDFADLLPPLGDTQP
ncbi:MAG: PKD domain-containing protein [Planctomycetes bacterium]|nr:PKD domain-containing protein [Planctomycetota bacterium]